MKKENLRNNIKLKKYSRRNFIEFWIKEVVASNSRIKKCSPKTALKQSCRMQKKDNRKLKILFIEKDQLNKT